MVSNRKALLDIARDLKIAHDVPKTREGWAKLMKKVGVKGIHIAERDTQRAKKPKPLDTFINTWSIEGFVFGRLKAGGIGLGHAREEATAGRAAATRWARALRSIWNGRVPTRACARGRARSGSAFAIS